MFLIITQDLGEHSLVSVGQLTFSKSVTMLRAVYSRKSEEKVLAFNDSRGGNDQIEHDKDCARSIPEKWHLHIGGAPTSR